jgi:hypothetical protein
MIRETALQNVPEAERARLAPEKLLSAGAAPRATTPWIDPKGPAARGRSPRPRRSRRMA